ncbi:glucan biosynthesis protein [Sphingomonas sp.]|uniref:glucan biosynthesis protein n=1 Tax=Sphingomonas sp. TaxID=28214 RepID=UPI003AFFFA63
MSTTRRDLLAALAAVATIPPGRLAAAGQGSRFSWAALQEYAAKLARRPYATPARPPAGIDAIDYDALNAVHYKATATQLGGRVRFFPVNRFQPIPVRIYVVDGDYARPFLYSPTLFNMPAGGPLATLGAAAGFSGFRAMNPTGESDWLAFAGASYFRAAGALDQYGLSARGIAINAGQAEPEEFPAFTTFWLGRSADGALLVDALLEGPSVVGAYRFVNRHDKSGVVQDIDAVLHLRRDVAHLGLAPLTSMFWYDQSQRGQASDWRPEIHDSDGLLILNGRGERLWRPLSNPPHPITSSFADQGPKGFGLLQRDRGFDHYQDDGVFYEKRPSAWVEPKGDWGAGAVTLVELPTDTETNDNIVVFWTPAAPARAGMMYELSYRLRWIAGEPLPPGPARVVDSWQGVGGRPGHAPVKAATKLVVDLAGTPLAGLSRTSGVIADLQTVRGRADAISAYPVVGQDARWRVTVDVTPEGRDPVDVRIALRRAGTALGEVCLTQVVPR